MGQEPQRMGQKPSDLRSCVWHTQKLHHRPKYHQNQIWEKQYNFLKFSKSSKILKPPYTPNGGWIIKHFFYFAILRKKNLNNFVLGHYNWKLKKSGSNSTQNGLKWQQTPKQMYTPNGGSNNKFFFVANMGFPYNFCQATKLIRWIFFTQKNNTRGLQLRL